MIGLRSLAAALALAAGPGAGLAGSALANDDVLRLSRDPANVVMPGITYDGWNYSPLDQINAGNIKLLSLQWTLQIGMLDSHEAAPLVIGDTMYLVSPRQDFVYAFDLAADGVFLWEFRPTLEQMPPAVQNCCGSPPRGLYYAENKLFLAATDGALVALDAQSGQQVWRRVVADASKGEAMAGNGIVVRDRFIAATDGYGARGKVLAAGLHDGRVAWTMYNVGPNADVGIGARFQKNYPYLGGANPAQESWFVDSWQHGGAGAAGFFTYDPDTNVFFYSTGSCRPGNPDYRRERGVVALDAGGRLTAFHNNFCSAQMARDGTTGELVWAFTLTPQDMWGLDEQSVTPLIDLDSGKAAIKASANGLFYAWDRAGGKLLGQPWMHSFQDIIKGPAFVDLQTGLPAYDADKLAFTAVADRRRVTQADPAAAERRPADYTGTEVVACPAGGARKWETDAYSPRTRLLYAHTNNVCGAFAVVAGDYKPGEPNNLLRRANVASVPRKDVAGQPTTVPSELKALDPIGRKVAWSRPMGDETRTGQLVTAGDLLFKGNNASGFIEVLDARNGEPLWSFRTGSGFSQSPVTYLHGGRQYVAVVASSGPVNAPIGFNAGPEAAARMRRGGTTLYVMAVPEM
ncbi:MAG: hypothetical protein FJX64_06125 [Alphaproteobacteria bacterium]|nr:hypothetical protein [Alphaproteobacteria bacterium]